MSDRYWICEITCIATKTVLVPAKSRKEAMQNLKSMDRKGVEGLDVNYGGERALRVRCEDKQRNHPHYKSPGRDEAKGGG